MAHTMDDFPVPIPHGSYELRVEQLHRHWQREDLIAQLHSVTDEEQLINLRAQWRRMSNLDEIRAAARLFKEP